MTARPILFSDPLVRAILDGTKTVTRRPVTKGNSVLGSGSWDLFDHATAERGVTISGRDCLYLPGEFGARHRLYPRWDVGDTLWVKEAHRASALDEWGSLVCIKYRAGGHRDVYAEDLPKNYTDRFKRRKDGTLAWKPSIFMAEEAARIRLKVTAVRVERVQEISEAQARAEGMPPHPDALNWRCRNSFIDTWNSIYAGRTDKPGLDWASNPWVWVIEFEVVS